MRCSMLILVTQMSRWGGAASLVQAPDNLHSWKVSVLAQGAA